MGGFLQKISDTSSDILADLKAGDIMALWATFWLVIVEGAIYFVFRQNVWLGIVFFVLSPVPIFALTVGTKMLLSGVAGGTVDMDMSFELVEILYGALGIRIYNKEENKDLEDIRIDLRRLTAGDRGQSDVTQNFIHRSFPSLGRIGYQSCAYLPVITGTSGGPYLKLVKDYYAFGCDWIHDDVMHYQVYEVEIVVKGKTGNRFITPCIFIRKFVWWKMCPREALYHDLPGEKEGLAWLDL